MISRFSSQIHDPSSCTAQKSESHDTEVERHPPKQYHIPSEILFTTHLASKFKTTHRLLTNFQIDESEGHFMVFDAYITIR